jgi:hypothetical protein
VIKRNILKIKEDESMISLKKVAAFGLAALMTLSMPLTAMASGTNTISGKGNVLDGTFDTYVVPTKILIAFNPNGYDINKEYTAVTDASAFVATDTYYVKSGSDAQVFKKVEKPYTNTAAAFTGYVHTGSYYKVKTDSNQIVSLNYAIINKADLDKKISVNFTAKYPDAAHFSNVTTKDAITFVDEEKKAEVKSDANSGGAARGEHKVFLQVVTAKTGTKVKVREGFKNATVVSTGGDTQAPYYRKNADGDFYYVASNSAVAITKSEVFVFTNEVSEETTGEQLVDAIIEKASSGQQLFVAEPNALSQSAATVANASVGFKLDKGTYTQKEDAEITFYTDQSEMNDKLELTALEGVAGFTLAGKMNPNADWTKAYASRIDIQAIYEVEEAEGTEEVIDGTKNQIADVVDGGDAVATWDGSIEGGGFYLSKTSSTGFDSSATTITSLKVDGVDVTSCAGVESYDSGKWIAVRWPEAIAAGVTRGKTSYDFVLVFDGKQYTIAYRE